MGGKDLTPRATYRLQLGSALTLADARELVPYLHDLGVSHLYLSPVLQARRGSTHGYDVIDPRKASEELGGNGELRALCEAALAAGMGTVLDVVPNHMATGEQNLFWRDPELRERFFDVDRRTGRHRRFFDVDDLGGVRVEEPEVFETLHRYVLDMVEEDLVDGLRIDHPDGLADPRGYLERLRAEGVPRVWVEKILEPGERLRDWPVEGTTGYDFLNDVQALFVDPAGEATLTELAGQGGDFHALAAEAKLEQAQTTFQPEVGRLRALLDVPELERALASLPVYRTYVEPSSGRVEDADREALAGLPDDLRRILLLEERGHDEFVTRFQQTTGPVMAKGVEDTAFYRYVRLLALNEVGGDPGRFGLSVEAFHRENAHRADRFPGTLLPGTTHDTKRSADVRARIGAIAGMADRWAEAVRRWHDLSAPLRDADAPDWVEELLVYQTLAGAWPIGPERLEPYLDKALREAKRNTSWVDQNAAWEAAVKRFATGLLTHEPFLAAFEPVADELAAAGARSSIGQLVLRLTSPGVPDIYNGDELPYFTLVDPDNRRPVDWATRRAALASPDAPQGDSVKLHVIREALALRRRRPEAFAEADYEPLTAGDGTCAYRRGEHVVVAVPVRGDEPELDVPRGKWRNVLEGVEDALGGYRVLLLERR